MFARTETLVRDTTPTAGTIVSYQDMSNPACFITLTSQDTTPWGTTWSGVNLNTGRIETGLTFGQYGWVVAQVSA